MTMLSKELDFYKKINVPVLVVNSDLKAVFSNCTFDETFGKITSIKKFQHNFNFDVCVLDNADITKYTPMFAAIESCCDFSAFVTYQDHVNELFNFELGAYKSGKNTVFLFKNVTYQTRYIKLKNEFDNLSKECSAVQSKHKRFMQLEQTARDQAVKMSLINKISHQIRHSMKLDVIINTALKELLELVGGFKGYYAVPADEDFLIKQIYPMENKKLVGKIIKFDDSIQKITSSKKYDISSCLKEYDNSSTNYKTPVNRILIPIYSTNEFFGVIVIFTKQKTGLKSITDVLEAISTQLATEIMQASLFKQLNDKNLELEKTLKELRETQLQLINTEKMASLGQLVAGVAHEINTPIGSINANNAIIKKMMEKFEPETQKKYQNYLDMMKNINSIDAEAINRITKIVNSLKKFVRLDEAELQETDINHELDLTLNLIQHETKNRIEIIKNYKKIPLIKCYPNMLNQVFMNILINACQSIEGKGKITISTDYKKSNLIVSIKDTGCGMDENTKNNIFNIGFTTKGVGIGTGIGLAITYKIIEKHNGKIEVKSTLKKGSEFIISIPSV